MGKPLSLYIFNEGTVGQVLFAALCGRQPVILFVDAHLRFLRPLLNRLAAALVSRKKARQLANLEWPLPWQPEFPFDRSYTTEIYPVVEDEVHAAYQTGSDHHVMQTYAYAQKKAVSDYTEQYKDIALLLEWMEANLPQKSWILRGAPRHADIIYRAYKKRSAVCSRRGAVSFPSALNAVNVVTYWLMGVFWLMARVRPWLIRPRYFRLAAERMGSVDDYIFDTVIDDPTDLLVVYRNAKMRREIMAALPLNRAYPSCVREDARIDPFRFFGLAGRLARDLWVIWRYRRHVDPSLFNRFAMLAAKKAMYAAFFYKFRPRYFLGHDDYSMDHIPRNQELRAVGGIAMGINHGLPLNTIVSQWREVDFDVYFSFGRHLYENYYKDSWPDYLALRPVGTPQMKRELHAQLLGPRQKDIGFFPIPHTRYPETMNEAFKVARHFKDRKFYIKMKPNREAYYVDLFDRCMKDAPPNVVIYTEGTSYELLLRIRYGLCFTTLFAEAIQFRVATFCLDTDPNLKMLYNRHFPGLAVPNGEAVIQRIEALESGAEIYDFKRFDEFIRIDGPDIFDVIRHEIGLPPNSGRHQTTT